MPDISKISGFESGGEVAPLKPLGGKGKQELPSGIEVDVKPLDLDNPDNIPTRMRSGCSKTNTLEQTNVPQETPSPTPASEQTKTMPRGVEKQPRGAAKDISEKVKLATEELTVMGSAIKGIHAKIDKAKGLIERFKKEAEAAKHDSNLPHLPDAEKNRLKDLATRREGDAKTQEQLVEKYEGEAKAKHLEMVSKGKEMRETKFVATIANHIQNSNINELCKFLKENKNAAEQNHDAIERLLTEDQLTKFNAVNEWVSKRGKEMNELEPKILESLLKGLKAGNDFDFIKGGIDVNVIKSNNQQIKKSIYCNAFLEGQALLKKFLPNEGARIDIQRVYVAALIQNEKSFMTEKLMKYFSGADDLNAATILQYAQSDVDSVGANIKDHLGDKYQSFLDDLGKLSRST